MDRELNHVRIVPVSVQQGKAKIDQFAGRLQRRFFHCQLDDDLDVPGKGLRKRPALPSMTDPKRVGRDLVHRSVCVEADFVEAVFVAGIVLFEDAFADDAVFDAAVFAAEAVFVAVSFTTEPVFAAVFFAAETVFVARFFADEALFVAVSFTVKADFAAVFFAAETVFVARFFADEADFVAVSFTAEPVFVARFFADEAVFVAVSFTAEPVFVARFFADETDFVVASFAVEAVFVTTAFALAVFVDVERVVGFVASSSRAMHVDANSTKARTQRSRNMAGPPLGKVGGEWQDAFRSALSIGANVRASRDEVPSLSSLPSQTTPILLLV